MAKHSTAFSLTVVCLVVGNAAQPSRRSPDNSYVPSRSSNTSWVWVPQVLEGQVSEQKWATDPWLPETIELQSQNQQQATPWFPQQIHSSAGEDEWLPLPAVETQHRVSWTEQRPQRGKCTFIYDDVLSGHIHPFLVDAAQEVFVYPDFVRGRQMVTLGRGSTVLVACPGRNNALATVHRPYVSVTCDGSQLRLDDTPVSWADLRCQKKPKPTVKRDGSCGRDSQTYHIGWSIHRHLFIPQITACFNSRLEASVSTAHKIHGRSIDAKVIEPSRPSFKTNRMFSVSLSRSYSKRMQKSLAQELLKTTQHLTTQGQEYFAKGHLAPDADFVLEAEQDATYYYVNVAPQWQAVNNGNWKSLEATVRRFGERRQATLEVYTGTHGILELPDYRNRLTKLYLGQSFGKKVVPVPALFWKVIYDPHVHNALAFVVVNDIRKSDLWNLGHPPCPDLCSRVPWVDWNTSDVTDGLTFCCSVDALRATIPQVPALGRVGLLVE
ncbi:uncharacterized protein LOC127003499 [Eriocheir sinensis]|uniref:uncharacterized protein LOC127003499 n=1 Tax=Eriocheir sinensis TaxID=95602 RepID=UPI0021C6ED61|nr:uncharacterized protein LOC127003499 [Eriocheir sinensis]